MKRSFARLFSILLLIFALMLSGCSSNSGTQDGGDNSGTPASASETPSPEEQTDFEKYNSYVTLMESISEMDGMIMDYFSVVKDQPEFELVDGMDYSLLTDTFHYYDGKDFYMDYAITDSTREPEYPEQDALLKALEEPYYEMDAALVALGSYFTPSQKMSDDSHIVNVFPYETDNMAQAAALHTQLYNAVEAFYDAAMPFMESMTSLVESEEQDELDRLQSEGMNIAYYTRVVINVCDEINTDILEQVSVAEELPALDMTNLEALYTQYQEAHTKLLEALADPAEVEKVPHWHMEWSSEDYSELIAGLDTALNTLMETARSQGDYIQNYLDFADAISNMISSYNQSFT